MLQTINRIFIGLVLLAALCGILLSILTIFLPFLAENDIKLEIGDMEQNSGLTLSAVVPSSIVPDDSPYGLSTTIATPPLTTPDTLSLYIYADGKRVGVVDCLEDFELFEDYASQTEFPCTALVPYNYLRSQDYKIFAVLITEDKEYASQPIELSADWSTYEENFWSASSIITLLLLISAAILLPITLLMFYIASHTSHTTLFKGEYTLASLISPLSNGKTILQKFHSFILSPYFWLLETVGIFIMLFYMAISAEVWKSETALVAFVLSGLMAFVIPYVWCVIWWYMEFREREPLRLVVTLFLWGCLAALMAIGFNTIAGAILGFAGLAFISTFMLTPPVEEFYKGAGLCLVSEHHEYDSIEDGILFGFVIGMGFSFIENWVYLLSNPMGSNILGWFVVFFLRAILFSANHGFYTALTGAIIGWLIERRFQAPGLGLFVGVPIAAFFHAMHNSGEMLIALLGIGGVLLYCCFLIPLFDYGGIIGLFILFAYVLFRRRKKAGRRQKKAS
ncbi:PrsW family intramembrane metalloprotease [Candidatus Micrarchaeota archaeon]|nr:PrsW family intramembrane metalloprotease [Candidatus Micrarchaeota archaeon]